MKKATLLKRYTTVTVLGEDEDLHKISIKRLGLLLLKLEGIFNVSNTCIDELLAELHFLTASASGPVIKEIVLSTLRKHSCTFEDSVISELVKDLTQLNPFCAAIHQTFKQSVQESAIYEGAFLAN